MKEPETTEEAFAAFFEATSMTPEEFDAAVAKGEPVELKVRLRPDVRIRES